LQNARIIQKVTAHFSSISALVSEHAGADSSSTTVNY